MSIAEIAGRAGGGGNEFASACDMRFGLRGKAIFNQMEVPLGILPGGTGTVTLPRHVGRNRALEMILGGVDVDAETAEAWGYLNRCFDTAAELRAYVDWLAARIASFPQLAVGHAKQVRAKADGERRACDASALQRSFLARREPVSSRHVMQPRPLRTNSKACVIRLSEVEMLILGCRSCRRAPCSR